MLRRHLREALRVWCHVTSNSVSGAWSLVAMYKGGGGDEAGGDGDPEADFEAEDDEAPASGGDEGVIDAEFEETT